MAKKFPPKKTDNTHLIKLSPKVEWSEYQKAIFKNIAQEKGHLIISAFAGSSKTTSLVESVKYIPKGKKVIVTAFNKIIQEELRQRLPSYAEAYTFHALGLRAIKQNFGAIEINDNKAFQIIRDIVGNERDTLDLATNLKQVVSFCKNGLIDTPKNISDLIAKFGIDTCEMKEDEFIRIVIKVLGICKSKKNEIDFDDMIWFPFVYALSVGKYDYVYVDEFQDLNKAQMIMAKSACKSDGRIIILGDFFQNLYSWRLSDTSIVEALKKEPTTKTLPLPISYRCPKKVIDLAKDRVSGIEASPNAIQGEISNISFDKIFSLAKPGSVILSRVNAPLIKTCLKFIKLGIKCNIIGRDVGNNLIYMIKKSGKSNIPDFLKWLDSWKIAEVYRLQQKGANTDIILDKVECFTDLCEDSKTLEEVKNKIDQLFSDTDNNNIVWLSTVHRFKGKESNNVFILDWTLRWHPAPNLPIGTRVDLDPSNEEANIWYVGISRSKENLYFVSK